VEKFSAESASHFYNLLLTYQLLSAGISIFLGLLWCFFGYRIFRILLVITVAVMGAVVGLSCATTASASPVAWAVGSLIGAIVGGVIGFVSVYVGAFLLGFGFASSAAWVLFSQTGNLTPDQVWWSSIIVGVAGGLLALLMMRPLLIVYTALTGALWVVATIVDLIVAVPALKDRTPLDQVYALNLKPFIGRFWPIIAIGVLILFVAGALYQFANSKSAGGGGASASEARASRKAKAA